MEIFTANYHTHTFRCGHAEGEDREYVEKAIEAGIKILGFSDHSPYPGTGELPFPMRMDISQMEDYCRSVLSLREEYKNDIEILFGLEVEYYPELFTPLMEQLKAFPLDYFLLGQHFTENQHDGTHCGRPGSDVLEAYTSQLIAGMETGLFTYIAHPDISNHGESPEEYERQARRICRTAREHNIPLEINLLGLATGRSYPYRRFWEVAASEGCKAIIGCDAHKPGDVYDSEAIAAGRALAAECGIELLETLSPVRPFA